MNFDRTFFDRGIDRRNTQSEKWDAVVADERLPLWVADMDFASPPAVQEALMNRATHPAYGYTRVDAQLDTDALIDWWGARHGVSFTREQVMSIPGVVTGIRQSVLALTKPGDALVIQPPVYGPFFSSIEHAGRRVLENRLILGENGWRMDLNGLEDCFRQGARLMILCNPHNPIGRVWRREELMDVLALCKKYDAFVFSDEIHAEFCHPGHPLTSFLSLPGAEERTILGVSASKTFNIAGLQQAHLIVPENALREKIKAQMMACGVTADNLMALCATRTAYRQGGPWLDGLLVYLNESRHILKETLAHDLPQVTFCMPEGTYLAFLDFRACGLDMPEVQRRLDQPGGVLLSDGTHFGEAGRGFMRLNFACPHTMLREALARLVRLLA